MRWADVSGERAASNLQGKIEADFSPFFSLSTEWGHTGKSEEKNGRGTERWKGSRWMKSMEQLPRAANHLSTSWVRSLAVSLLLPLLHITRAEQHTAQACHTRSQKSACVKNARPKGSADRRRILIGTCASKASARTPRRP